MTGIVIAIVVLIVLAAAAFYVVQQRNRKANAERADQLRAQAATTAQATLPGAQERAAEADAKAEEARAAAQRAEAEAEEARVVAARQEAEHEAQVRAADRLDPRVDHKAENYEPQVAGTTDRQPTPPAEVNAVPAEPVQPAEPAAPAQPAEPATPAEPAQQARPAEQAQPAEPATQQPTQAPLLPRRTPGAQDMPGAPIEKTDEGGGWFSKKGPGES